MSTSLGVIRIILIALIALMLATFALRDAVGRAPVDHPLAVLKLSFAGHPANLKEQIMLEAARAAKDGRELSEAGGRVVERLARERPLAPEPFLIEGAVAQIDGDTDRAIALYEAARNRDPRAVAARMVLIDNYFRAGMVEEALGEIIALRKIRPRGTRSIVPALVEYAKQPESARILSPLLEGEDRLREALLQQLATETGNLEAIEILAPPRQMKVARPWEGRLLASFVSEGRLREARAMWNRFSGGSRSTLVVDGEFRGTDAPAPFNWELPTTSAGVATIADAGLEIIYFGREATVLARQLLTLGPGRYVLTSQTSGSEQGDLIWIVRCHQGPDITQLPVGSGGAFTVPGECEGQWLELAGVPSVPAKQSELSIRRVSVLRDRE